MIFKIRTPLGDLEGDFGRHVISDYVHKNVLPFQYTNIGKTCGIKLDHRDVRTHAPGMVIFILCMRAVNYAIFKKKIPNATLRWKPVFKNSRDAVHLGFLCERLPY